jgi:NADH dehydrogenase
VHGRLAVTGASGFIGRMVTRLGSQAGLEIDGLTRSDEGARRVLEAGGRPVPMAAFERGALARAFRGAGAVVHLAQIGAERGRERYEAVNVGGTRAVSEAAREAGIGRVVFLSGLGVARYGINPHCTNRYFLSKLASELELYRTVPSVVVFRPSYILGSGGGLIAGIARGVAAGELERVGDGRYRLQPIGVRDAAAAILSAAGVQDSGHRVLDLVGPEAVGFQELVERVARLMGAAPGQPRIREISFEDARRRAVAGGYLGMPPEELDCLLCDEIGSPGPLEALLSRPLTPLDAVLSAALGGA